MKPAARRRSASARAPEVRPPEFDQAAPREHEAPESLIPGARDDDLAEELGEESVEAATSGQTAGEDNLNEEVPEETGGPFVESTTEEETGRPNPRRDK